MTYYDRWTIENDYDRPAADNPQGMDRYRREIEERYGQDSQSACKYMENTLDGWTKLVEQCGNSTISPVRPTADPSNIITRYQSGLDYTRSREDIDACWYARNIPYDDGKPYFLDPAPIAFDPEESFLREIETGSHKDEGDILLADIWKDPLARTLWLGIKARHLTSQHFRQSCLDQAYWIRMQPPRTADQLYLKTGETFIGHLSPRLSEQLYPYIIRVLIDEGSWPYFWPGSIYIAAGPLPYVVKLQKRD